MCKQKRANRKEIIKEWLDHKYHHVSSEKLEYYHNSKLSNDDFLAKIKKLKKNPTKIPHTLIV